MALKLWLSAGAFVALTTHLVKEYLTIFSFNADARFRMFKEYYKNSNCKKGTSYED
jgi:hypothetical protein